MAVATPQGRGASRPSSSCQLVLGASASRPSSTAAKASSAPATGRPPRVTRTDTGTVSRTFAVGCGTVTATSSRWARRPTRSSVAAMRKLGLARSTVAVGARQSSASWRKACHQSPGSRQPQVKKLHHGASRRRPRSSSALTTTLGDQPPASSGTRTVITGSAARTVTRRASSTPSRSTVTSAVACAKGVRSCSRTLCPGSTSRVSGSRSMRSSSSCANQAGSPRDTQARAAALLARPASSRPTATSSTSPPAGGSFAASMRHSRRPRASLRPRQSSPSSCTSRRLS